MLYVSISLKHIHSQTNLMKLSNLSENCLCGRKWYKCCVKNLLQSKDGECMLELVLIAGHGPTDSRESVL